MLTAEGCRGRRERFWAALDARSPRPCQWAVLGEPRHLAWLAGFSCDPFSFRSANAHAALILGRDGSSVLVADNLQGPDARAALVDRVAEPRWYDGRQTAEPRRLALDQALLAEMAERDDAPSIAIDSGLSSAVALALIQGGRADREVIPVDAMLGGLQRRKDADELAVLARSLAASDAALASAQREVRPGMSELEVCSLVQRVAAASVGTPVLVYGDFVSGPRCEAGGGLPSSRTIAPGELVLIDFSVVLGGYRGDVCQTFVCGGPASDAVRRLHAACLEVHEIVRPLLCPGTPAREIDRAAKASLARQGLAEYYTSHSGHGLGLGHPDPPYLVSQSSDTLVEGDVVAVEPGLYLPGTAGLRLEHDYLITADGPRQLSGHEFRLEQAQ